MVDSKEQVPSQQQGAMDVDIDMNSNLVGCNEEAIESMVDNVNDENDKVLELYNGKEFDSEHEAYSFYLRYAKSIGFGISRKHSRKSKISKEFIDVKFACTRYGTKRESNANTQRPCLKIDCKAMLHVKRRICGKWYVENFVKEHNHEVNPSHANYFPCHRSNNMNTLHGVGVGTTTNFASMAKQQGGCENVGCLEKDIRNHLDKEKHLALAQGDAKSMLELFLHMQEENPNFFYAMDLDDEQRLKNVLWVDAKSREDYKVFGDVVSFDTTYITNKYKMPFAPFIGVNNHFQSVLLGCALLSDESTSTFTWLMQTWVRAMGGEAPGVFLTDQDRDMKVAIRDVFPNTKHRFCLWHILKKIPEKLGHVIKHNENFMRMFDNCIYNSWTEEDFEKTWLDMIEKFELQTNGWLKSLFEDRKYWIPTYMTDTFFAGMSTTQRTESVNAFFDKYVCKKTSLKEFVEQYKVALQDREEKEVYADFNTWHKKPPLKSPSPFEKQMSMIYTHEVLKKFQAEVLGVSACYPLKAKEDGTVETFKVQDFEKNEGFVVNWHAGTHHICCLCRMFEYCGFLCRHSLSVLQSLGIFSLPPHYILKRWSKDAKSLHSTVCIPKEIDTKKQRFDELYREAIRLSQEGSLSLESFNIAYNALKEALKKCVMVNHSLNETMNVGKENVDST